MLHYLLPLFDLDPSFPFSLIIRYFSFLLIIFHFSPLPFFPFSFSFIIIFHVQICITFIYFLPFNVIFHFIPFITFLRPMSCSSSYLLQYPLHRIHHLFLKIISTFKLFLCPRLSFDLICLQIL